MKTASKERRVGDELLHKLNDTKFWYAQISTDIARLSKAFGPKASFVAFDAFGDLLFFNSKKK